MGNLPGSHGHRGFGHGHGHGGQNPGVFMGPPGPGQNQGYYPDRLNPVYGVNPGQGQDPRVAANQHPVANVTPPPYSQGNYPPQGYPPQAQGYPQGQNFQGYGPGYPQQGYPGGGYPGGGYPGGGYPGGGYPGGGYPGGGYPGGGYPGGGYPPQGAPGASMGEAACCGACVACLTCLLCSCCQGPGGGAYGEDVGHDGNEAPGTANVTSPDESDNH